MRRSLLLLFVMIAAQNGAAQGTSQQPTAMARADSAWKRGDRAAARVRYAEALSADTMASRAVFRLAQLETSDERALALYRRYIALEPDDPWGHMAEGDLLARTGRLEDALVAYDGAHAIAPNERDVALGRARLLDRAGRSQQAADELTAWTFAQPNDGEAWDLLGRAQLRTGRPRAAGEAFLRAERLGVRGAGGRLDASRAAAAPAITPELSSLGDSDGNRTTRFGGSIDIMASDGVRVGAGMAFGKIGADIDQATTTDLDFRIAANPSALVRLSGSVGAVRYAGFSEAAPIPGQGPGQGQGPPAIPQQRTGEWSALRVLTRMRIRAPGAGPSLDLRLEHAPVGFNPMLIQNRVERSEARATLEAPVAAFRLRGIGRFGHLSAIGEAPNGRTSLEGAIILPLGRMQPSLQVRRAGFDHASTAGYFAPRSAETIETGVYAESGEDGALSLAFDAGAGMQRVTPHDAVAGPWSRVWRLWTQASVAMGTGRAWFTEIEAYDAPFALEGAATAGSWRFLAVTSGLRWSIR